MFNNKSTKKAIIVLVALCLALGVVLSACSSAKTFEPVATEGIGGNSVESNGGVAVKYGDYIYYVNGYQSDSTAANTYTNVYRIGEVVRIKIAELDKLIDITKAEDKKSTQIAEEISNGIREHAEVIVPNFYYSANTSTTSLNGIYIFNDRLYMLTPNDALTAGGASLASQLCLNSYKLDGSDKQTHAIIESNSAQVMLSQVNSAVYATVVANSALYSIKLGAKVELTAALASAETVPTGIVRVNKSVSNVKFDLVDDGTSVIGTGVFYNDEDGSICHFVAGADAEKVLVENVEEGGHEGHNHKTKTITSVNNGYVYYTQADSNSSYTDNNVYYATDSESGKLLMPLAPADTYYCRKNEAYYVGTDTMSGKTVYTIRRVTWDSSKNEPKIENLLNLEQNDQSITLNSIQGDILTYTSNGFTYHIKLADWTTGDSGTIVASGLSTSTAGWSVAKIVGNYVFTPASGSISVVRLDGKTNTTSADITLKDAATEE